MLVRYIMSGVCLICSKYSILPSLLSVPSYTVGRIYILGKLGFITRGQFWPSGIVVACVCLFVCPSVCVCGKHLLVRAITHHPSKLGSLNLTIGVKDLGKDPYCFGGWLTLTFKVKFNFKVKIYPIVSLSISWLSTNWSYNFQIWNKNAS